MPERILPRQIRKQFIAMSLRRATAGTGSAHGFFSERTAVMKTLDLTEVLRTIAWAVIGGVATRSYMPERSTLDLDILIHKRDSQKVGVALKHAGYDFQQPLLIGGSAWKSPDGRSLDVIERDHEWVDEALLSYGKDPQGLPVVQLAYLVLMKLQASRTQDLADVSRMLGEAEEGAIEKTRGVLRRFLPEAVDDFESLVQLGRLDGRRER